MFKNLSSLEKTMRFILVNYNKTSMFPDVENNRDLAYALYCCCERKYLINLYVNQTCSGDYIFQATDNLRVSLEGLKFIKETSFQELLIQNIFSLLRGILGFFLGIISTLIVDYLSRYL